MNGQYQQHDTGIGWIILLVLLYIIFNPISGPIDDARRSRPSGDTTP